MLHEQGEAFASKSEKRSLRLTGTSLVLLVATSAAAACSGSGGATAGERGSFAGATGAAGEAPSPEAGASGRDSASEAGAGNGNPASEAGAGGEGQSDVELPEACRPTSKTDQPDDDFIDANCDGIDGEAKHAVFVSPDGADSADGSMERPVQSITQAVSLAQDGDLDIYVCNGIYRENVVIDAPVSIYGGYDCIRDWKRTKDVAVLQAGAGLPLLIKNVDGKVHLERLAFRATAAVGAGHSSQAGAIIASSDVTLSQVELKAGIGAAGAAGIQGADATSTPPLASAQGASTATTSCYVSSAGDSPGCAGYAAGGYSATATQSCGSDFQMRGGRGGDGGNVWLEKGKPGCFNNGSGVVAEGFYGQYDTGDGNWRDVSAASSGAMGADGADGLAAAMRVGSLIDGVYSATNSGTDGAHGQPGWPGKGGTGGRSVGHLGDICGSDYRLGSGGGQGGLGGCGGGPASRGLAGGGSIGLVVVDSAVKISSARFVVGDGGRGGDGALGGAAQPGALGADGGSAQSTLYQGARGQTGGGGGRGGDGGPGGGGPSIALLYSGAMPEVTDAVYEIGTPGDGGQAFSGLNGASGATGEVVSLDEILGNKP